MTTGTAATTDPGRPLTVAVAGVEEASGATTTARQAAARRPEVATAGGESSMCCVVAAAGQCTHTDRDVMARC